MNIPINQTVAADFSRPKSLSVSAIIEDNPNIRKPIKTSFSTIDLFNQNNELTINYTLRWNFSFAYVQSLL